MKKRRKKAAPPPGPAPLPCPTRALPGSQEKVEILRRRVLYRQPLHQEGDTVRDPGRVLAMQRMRNGRDVPTGGEAAVPTDSGEKATTIVVRNATSPARLVASTLPALDGLGDRLRSMREAKKLSLGQVALATGITQQALSAIELGKRRQVTLPVLWALADFYRVGLDELVGRVGRN